MLRGETVLENNRHCSCTIIEETALEESRHCFSRIRGKADRREVDCGISFIRI